MDRGRYSDNVRIVQIDTHFVEIDAVNFRAVVQSLTGKDSSTVWPGNGLSSSSSSSSLAAAASARAETGCVETEAGKNYYYYDNNNDDARNFHHVAVKPGDDEQSMMTSNKNEIKYQDGDDIGLSFMKVNDLSFKDFDSLLSEFYLMEDLPLW